ncbi:MAG: alpha/beta fold hydrolase [Bryobacteraceae bacterium]
MFTEASLHIREARRVKPAELLAESIARKGNASWTNESIAASDGAQLSAWMFRPERADQAVVLLHGFGDSRRGMQGYAAFFAKHGYAALTPDSRAHGASGGDLVTFGVRETEDLIRWIAWLRDRGFRRVHAFGASMGGAVVLSATGREGAIHTAIAECAFAGFHQVAYDGTSGNSGVPRALLYPLIEPGFIYARVRYGVDLASISPLEAVRKTKSPILLIHGTADRTVPVEHGRLLHREGPTTELWEVEGARHVRAWNLVPEEYERRVLEWMKRHAPLVY